MYKVTCYSNPSCFFDKWKEGCTKLRKTRTHVCWRFNVQKYRSVYNRSDKKIANNNLVRVHGLRFSVTGKKTYNVSRKKEIVVRAAKVAYLSCPHGDVHKIA